MKMIKLETPEVIELQTNYWNVTVLITGYNDILHEGAEYCITYMHLKEGIEDGDVDGFSLAEELLVTDKVTDYCITRGWI